jgi:hypothetical protein
MNKQTELEHHNEFIMYQGKKINIKDCVMELVQSTKVDPNMHNVKVVRTYHIDKFGEMFIVDDNDKKFHSKY